MMDKTDDIVIGTSNGVEITDAMLDEMAEGYERGEWPGEATGEIVMGRPRLADEEVRPVTFKLPVSKIIALDRRAFSQGGTRSQALREAVDEYLARA